jgi:predicted permease
MNLSFNELLTQSILVLVGMILMGTLSRKLGIFKDEHSTFFARIVTDITLPALIFLALSHHKIQIPQLFPAFVLISVEILSGLLAWVGSKIFRLTKPQTGALVLASMFGSSAFLGYAVIKDLYPDNYDVLAEAAIISEIGVGLLIFTLGVGIAVYFGKNNISRKEMFKPIFAFFKSHIFFALIAGLLVSFIGLPENNILINSFIKAIKIVATANTLMVTMTIGLMLHFKNFRKVIVVVTVACIIKLILQPYFALAISDFIHISENYKKILIIEASMPSAALAAVFARRYECDGELASILVFATFISSIFTIITVSYFIFSM